MVQHNNNQVRVLTIEHDDEGMRVDNYLLARLKGVPRALVYRILRKGQVRVNKKRVKPLYRLKAGDMIRIPPVKLNVSKADIKLDPKLHDFLKSRVLYEDDELMIINKPSGMAVHGGSGLSAGLVDYLLIINGDKIELAHRLDRDTSGCLLIAKTRQTLRLLHELLRDHKVTKVYHLLAYGHWPKKLNKIDAPLKKNILSSGARKVSVSKEGKPALTTFQVLEYFKDATYIAAQPKTGRTHQIRVHAKVAGHTILGDTKYMDKEVNNQFEASYGVKRLCLHAYELRFKLPGKEALQVVAPLDEDMVLVIERMKDGIS